MSQLRKHLRWRLLGVLLLGVAVVAYEPSAGDPMNRLLIPVIMASAAWLMTQNLAAVALGACLLAAIHSHPSSTDWVEARAYPGLAVVAAVILATIFGRRFYRRIEETREARWAARRSRGSRTSSLPKSMPESD